MLSPGAGEATDKLGVVSGQDLSTCGGTLVPGEDASSGGVSRVQLRQEADVAEKEEATERQHPRTEQGEVPEPSRRRKHWVWPVGLAMAGFGGMAAVLFRGCWHGRMGWPIRYDDEFSYQVCVDCAAKRLFDDKTFRAYGPYGYDLHELIARERVERLHRLRKHEEALANARRKAEKKQA
jgi:hypothetical protein